jgi:hypothetical protein
MFNAAFTPAAMAANSTRPEISEQITAEVLTALDSLRRVGEYNARAKESRQFLVDTLKKYDKTGGTATAGAERRKSAGVVTPVAQMGASAPVGVATEGVMRVAGVPVAGMVGAGLPAPMPASLPAPPSAAQTFPYTTTNSNIDASRDPRRR